MHLHYIEKIRANLLAFNLQNEDPLTFLREVRTEKNAKFLSHMTSDGLVMPMTITDFLNHCMWLHVDSLMKVLACYILFTSD
jgi:hypothetical protein